MHLVSLVRPEFARSIAQVKWLLVAICLITRGAYQAVEKNLRMLEPYYRLRQGHAPPSVLRMDYTTTMFLPIQAAINGDFLLSFFGVGSFLLDILIILVASSTPMAGQENSKAISRPTFITSMLVVLIASYLVLALLIRYGLRRKSFLPFPRMPMNVASVIGYIHQSKMLYDFVDLEEHLDDTGGRYKGLSSFKLSNKSKMSRKTYGFGWFTDRDGEVHYGVDEEDLLPYSAGRNGWRDHAKQKSRRKAYWSDNW